MVLTVAEAVCILIAFLILFGVLFGRMVRLADLDAQDQRDREEWERFMRGIVRDDDLDW